MVMKVSQSKAKTWRKCRQAYHYKYVEKLRPRVKSRSLQFGTVVHAMIEAHAEGDDPFQVLYNWKLPKMFDEEREIANHMLADIGYLMTDYFAYYGENDLIYIRHNKRNAEHNFEIEIESGILVTGKIDAFAKQRNKKLRWMVEHKTFKRAPTDDHRWRNIQSAVYLRILDMLGWPSCDGMVWDYLCNKELTRPQLLKNGQLSRKKIVTLPSVVLEFMREKNLSTSHYKEYIKGIEDKIDDHFFRVFTPVKQNTVDLVFKDFLDTCRDIAENHGREKTKCIDLHCDQCEYNGLCRAELLNLDFDFIKKRDFVHGDENENQGGTSGKE